MPYISVTGYDFSNYAKASIKRRVLALAAAQCQTVAELIPRILREDGFVTEAIAQLSVPVSEMFRDPTVFKALRETIVPLLQTYPRINIWQAGCATGVRWAHAFCAHADNVGLCKNGGQKSVAHPTRL